MSGNSVWLSALVGKLNDSIRLFDCAARHAAGTDRQELFSSLCHRERAIVSSLMAEIGNDGAVPSIGGTRLGALRLDICDVAAKLAVDMTRLYLRQLQAQQRRILKAFIQASQPDSPPRVRELVQRYLPDVQYIHDEIDALRSREG